LPCVLRMCKLSSSFTFCFSFGSASIIPILLFCYSRRFYNQQGH
jgi:hypothetical protein